MKKIISLVILVIMVFILSGCSNKQGATPNTFKKVLNDNGFYVNNVTTDVLAQNIKNAMIASNKKYQIEYFEFVSAKDGKNAFRMNKKIFEAKMTKGAKTKYNSNDNYSFYSLTTDNNYYCVVRSNNTLIYINSNIVYKKDINKIISKLNY